MPTTRKQKSEARKSREVDMSSDMENMDIILGSNHVEREEAIRRPESSSYNALTNHDSNSHSNSRENEIKGFAGNGHNSREAVSNSEINRLSGELNQRITQGMNDLMSRVSSQIKNVISEAINEQVLPQIEASLRFGQGQMPRKGLNVPAERPECRPEKTFNRKIKSSSRDEFPRSLIMGDDDEDTHYQIFPNISSSVEAICISSH